MDRIIVIYDTSFLLRESEPVRFERDTKSARGAGEAPLPPVSHIIPRQVKEEIHARLDSTEAESAQRARTRCSKIMALPGCDEADLAGVTIPAIRETYLGPQTERDQRLVGLAVDYLREFPQAAVYVATHDGGILAELSHRRSKEGLNVFTASTRAQLDASLAVRVEELREEAASERETRSSERAGARRRRFLVRAAVGAVLGGTAGYYFVRQKRGDSVFTLLAGGLGGAVIGGWLATQVASD